MKPAGGPSLTASEIGAFVYCFVPMTTGLSRAVLKTLRNGAP
jgi:hypothetical protein